MTIASSKILSAFTVAAMLVAFSGPASAVGQNTNTTIQEGEISTNDTFQLGDGNDNATYQQGLDNANRTLQRGTTNWNETGQFGRVNFNKTDQRRIAKRKRSRN